MAFNLLMSKEGFKTRLEKASERHALKPGEVLLQIDQFALTANVVGYAMTAVTIGYYDFFPVENPENQQYWGRVPTWGIATVIESKCDFVPVGQRVYGLLPISQYLVCTPKKGRDGFSWIDSAPHRAKRDIVYNTYIDLSKDKMYPGPDWEEAMILVRPLFMTAWLLREAVWDLNPDAVLITSASSKTGAALAALLKFRRERIGETRTQPKIVGLTSQGNMQYVKSLAYYDEVLTYSSAAAKSIGMRIAIVDLAGNVRLLKELQTGLKEKLVKILSVGATHVAESDLSSSFAGKGFDPNYAKPEFFFAPKYAAAASKRNPEALTVTAANDWLEFIPRFPLHVNRCMDVHKTESIVLDFVHGRVPGSESWVGTLNSPSRISTSKI